MPFALARFDSKTQHRSWNGYLCLKPSFPIFFYENLYELYIEHADLAIDGRQEGLLPPRHRVEELELRRRHLLRHGKSLTLQIPAISTILLAHNC